MPSISQDKNSNHTVSAFNHAGGMDPSGQRAVPAEESPALRILYVEDNDDVRETTMLLLESPSREVVAFATGEEAQDYLVNERYDVLFTDVNLPGMSGSDLARSLLAREPDHWVVLCSGRPLHDDVYEWGPHVRILPKLFRIEDLERLLDDIAEDVGARRDN